MAELTVDYNNAGGNPSGKFTIMPRSQGFEWKTRSPGLAGLPSSSQKMIAFTPKIDFSPIKVILQGTVSHFSGRFLDSLNNPLRFNEADAMKIYNFLCEQIEWSPESIGEGTAHPSLAAASRSFSNARKTRKARK